MRLCRRSEGQPELRRVALFLRAALRALIVVGLPVLVLAPFDSGGGALHDQPAPSVRTAIPRARLYAGSRLKYPSYLVSENRRYRLELEADGDLVLYRRHDALWSSHTAGHPGAVAKMQSDGNFVIYQGHRAIWSSNTRRGASNAYHLLVNNHGEVVIYSPTGRPIWVARRSSTRRAVRGQISHIRSRPADTHHRRHPSVIA